MDNSLRSVVSLLRALPALSVASMLILLAGCSTMAPLPDIPAPPPMQQGAAPRPYHPTISLGGRLSVRYQENGAEQAVHGSFTWNQSPERTLVTLLSPLGQVIATIDINSRLATLTQAGQPPRTAANVDELVAAAFGWPLPVAGMRDWLQGFGIDASGQRFVATTDAVPSVVSTQDGWRLQYATWNETGRTPAQHHPRRIDLERKTAQAGDVSLRIVIDEWQPGSPG